MADIMHIMSLQWGILWTTKKMSMAPTWKYLKSIPAPIRNNGWTTPVHTLYSRVFTIHIMDSKLKKIPVNEACD